MSIWYATNIGYGGVFPEWNPPLCHCGGVMYKDSYKPCSDDPIEFKILVCNDCDKWIYEVDYKCVTGILEK